MTSIMSTLLPISSVIAVEGVSGEMAKQAFMPFEWILLIKSFASFGSALVVGRVTQDGRVELG